MSSAPSSQRPSRPGSPMSGIQSRPPMTTAQATGIETAGLLESQRDVAPRASRAASPASTTSAASKIGKISSGAASTSIPASRMVRCFVYPFSTDDHQAHQNTGDLPQPEPGARLRDSLRLPGVHLPLPEDRPAGLRGHPRRLRPRRPVRGAQILEALPLVVPERRGVPRGGDQSDPGRSRRRHATAADAGDGCVQRPGRHHDHGRGHAPEPRLVPAQPQPGNASDSSEPASR